MIEQAAERGDGIASIVPVHPFLFALYPIVRLYAENRFEVELADVIAPLIVVMAATTAGFALLIVMLRDARRAAIITTAVVVPVMLFGVVRELLEPDLIVLLGASLGFIVVGIVIARRSGPSLGRMTLGLNVLSLVLVVLVVIPAAQGAAAELERRDAERADVLDLIAETHATRKPDIYHLVVDRYGSQIALEAGPGIDNAEFVGWLREAGFQVVDDSLANYAKTTLSLGSTLGMRLLDDIAAEMGPRSENLAPVVERIRRSRAGRFLQAQGYEYIHIGSWFSQTRTSKVADRSYDPGTEVTFDSTLYDTTVLPVIIERVDPREDLSHLHAESAEYQFELLEALAPEPGPKYVFAHLLVPHPPYVFLRDGRFDPPPANFRTQIGDTNRRLRSFVEPLLALPEEERPIIIIQADEGSFPRRLQADQDGFDWSTASDDELLTKFGILNAMYLPGPEGVAPLPDGMTAVNTYPELFRRYFDSDIALQPDRVMASSRARPYDLLDITDRLVAIAADRVDSLPGS